MAAQRTPTLFALSHLLQKWWSNPLLLGAATVVTAIAAHLVSLYFAQTGSVVALFALTLAHIPLVLRVADDTEKTSDITRSIPKILIVIAAATIAYGVIAAATPTKNLDQHLKAQWNDLDGLGVEKTPHPSTPTFVTALKNNVRALIKAALLGALFGTGGLYVTFFTASTLGIHAAAYLTAKKSILFSSLGPQMIAYFTAMYVPHFVFETSAFLIAGIGATKLSLSVLRYRGDQETLERNVKTAGGLLALALILVLAGAAIEAFIDPWIAGQLAREEFFLTLPSDPLNLLS